MTIWVFGDSYTRHYRNFPDSWLNLIATNINTEIRSYSKSFSTTSFTFKRFFELRNQIKDTDVIIFSPSSLNPTTLLSDGYWFHRVDELDKDKLLTYKFYKEHINFIDELRKTYLTNFFYNLHHVTKKKNLHTIVFIPYDEIEITIRPIQDQLPLFHIPIGQFQEVSRREWTNEVIMTKDIPWMTKNDMRLNHLTRSNHYILANKIIDNIKNKTPINLTIGFNQNFLDDEIIKDTEFYQKEFYPEFIKNIGLGCN